MKTAFIEIFQVRKLARPPTLNALSNTDFSQDSLFVCNEMSMDRAMSVSDGEAIEGNQCVIIPITVSHVED